MIYCFTKMIVISSSFFNASFYNVLNFWVNFDLLIFLILFLREGRHWRAIRWPFGSLLESMFRPFLQRFLSKPYEKG